MFCKISIYHLHIPRTSGVFIRNIVQKHYPDKKVIADHYSRLYDERFQESDFINGHFALSPVKFSDTTFTILRDPVERTFSYMIYVWMHYFSQQYPPEKILEFFINTEHIRNNMSNMQSKFLTGFVNYDKYNDILETKEYIYRIYNNWFIENNEKTAIEQIKQNNIIVLDYDDNKLYDKICDIYSVSDDNREPINQATKEFDSLKNIFYKDIEEMNKEDILLYNSIMV